MVFGFDLLTLLVVCAESFSHVGNQHVQEMDLHQELEDDVDCVKVNGLRAFTNIKAVSSSASIGEIPSEPNGRSNPSVSDTKSNCFFFQSVACFSFWAWSVCNIVVNLVVSKQKEWDRECDDRDTKDKHEPFDIKDDSDDYVNDRGNLINELQVVESFGQEGEKSKCAQDSLIPYIFWVIWDDELICNGIQTVENNIKPSINTTKVLISHYGPDFDHK